MRPAPGTYRLRGWFLRVAALLLFAAVLNLLIAAACALWSPVMPDVIIHHTNRLPRDTARWVPATWDDRGRWEDPAGFSCREFPGFGLQVFVAEELAVDGTGYPRPGPFNRPHVFVLLQAGWPVRSLKYVTVPTGHEYSAWFENADELSCLAAPPALQPRQLFDDSMIPAECNFLNTPALPRRIPLHVSTPGFLLGTVFYAALIATPCCAIGALRRALRRRRLRCERCGYNVRSLVQCPECGSAVRWIRVEHSGNGQ